MIDAKKLMDLINELDTGYNGYGPDGYGFYFPAPTDNKGDYVRLDDVLESIQEALDKAVNIG